MDECERILCFIFEGKKNDAIEALKSFKGGRDYENNLAEIFDLYLKEYTGVCSNKITKLKSNVKDSETRTKIHIFKTILNTQIKLDNKEFKEASLLAEDLKLFLDTSEVSFKFLQKFNSLFEGRNDFDEKKFSDEKRLFLKLLNENLEYVEGDTWFIVSSSFFSLWKRKVGYLIAEKSPRCLLDQILPAEICPNLDSIDNSSLIDNNLQEELDENPKFFIMKGKVELHDFIPVPSPAYNYLIQTYKETERLERKIIKDKSGNLKLDLYYSNLSIVFFKDQKIIEKKHHPSNRSSFKKVCKVFLNHMNLKKSEENLTKINIWKLNKKSVSLEKLAKAKNSNQMLKVSEVLSINFDQLIEEVVIQNNDYIFIDFSINRSFLKISTPKEKKCFLCNENKNLKTCKCSKLICEDCLKKHEKECLDRKENPKRTSFSFFSCFCRSKSSKISKNKSKFSEKSVEAVQSMASTASFSLSSLKVTGLSNLGNTCYMNSALQCLIHCEPLSQYFLELNPTSSLNKKPLIRCYINLLQGMCGRQESLAPGDIKRIISKQNRYFEGLGQHDSQEFLTFFISHLHEELNEKPLKTSSKIISNPNESSEESWKRFKNDNQSIISDLFYGQFRSTVSCLTCLNKSVTYETFNCLSLPIPTFQQDLVDIRFVPLDLKQGLIILSLQFETGKTFFDIKNEACKFLALPITSLKIFELRESFPFAEVNYQEKYVRGNSRIIFEVPENEDFFGFFYIQMKNSRSQLRIFEVSINDTFESLIKTLEIIMKPLVDEISQTTTFLEFSSVRNSFIDCFVCNSKKCLGFCKIKPSEKPLQRFLQHNKKIFVRIEIIKAEENFYLDDKLVEFKKVQKNQSLSLSDCLQNFSHPETLEKSEAWACDKCKNKGSAQKMIELSIIPRILIIHLKRFRINKQNREKINAQVKFPKTELRLDEFVSGSIRSSYDLFAVCNHMGGLYGGHYTANVYSTRGSRWFECNDSQITESDEISESSSYVLFYRSKDNLKS